jgi:hypothetical protein
MNNLNAYEPNVFKEDQPIFKYEIIVSGICICALKLFWASYSIYQIHRIFLEIVNSSISTYNTIDNILILEKSCRSKKLLVYPLVNIFLDFNIHFHLWTYFEKYTFWIFTGITIVHQVFLLTKAAFYIILKYIKSSDNTKFYRKISITSLLHYLIVAIYVTAFLMWFKSYNIPILFISMSFLPVSSTFDSYATLKILKLVFRMKIATLQ